MTRLRSFADLASTWRATRAPTAWRTSRSGRPCRRIAGGVTVSVELDRRSGRYRVRLSSGGAGALWHTTFATLSGAQQAVDRLEVGR